MSSLDYLDLCRLCLMKDRVSVPIFEGEGDVRQIFLKIAACLPVKVAREDKLPKKICDDCVYKVELLYQFWNTTANAEKQLLQWLGEVGLEDKQGYVTGVLNPSTMKQEENNSSGLGGAAIQVTGVQPGIGIGVIDNMGLGMPLIIPSSTQQQLTAVPMDTSTGPIQPIQPIQQAVPGPSSQPGHEQITQSQTNATTHQQDEEEDTSEDEENSDDDCDGDDGLPVKEESEEDPNNSRTIEPTTFVNVSLACDEAGPSGLQQQKIVEIPEMAMPQTTDGDPKSGNTHNHIRKAVKERLASEETNGEHQQQLPQNSQSNCVYAPRDCHRTVPSKNTSESSGILQKIPMRRGIKMKRTCKRRILAIKDSNEIEGPSLRSCNVSTEEDATSLLSRVKDETNVTNSKLSIKNSNKSCFEDVKPRGVLYKKLTDGNYTCDICHSTFEQKSKIMRHITSKHSFHRPFKCSICSKAFKYKCDLKAHKLIHETIDSSMLHRCDKCDYGTKTKNNLKSHYIRKHTDDYKFSCEHCGKRFKMEWDLKFHVGTHGSSQHMCDICGRFYTSSYSLYKHRKVAHLNDYKYQCNVCNKRLLTQENLDNHMLQHSQTYTCKECAKVFASKRYLSTHMTTHTGVKPYPCHVCEKNFRTSHMRNTHLLTHSAERPHICDLCGQAFKRRYYMIEHRRKHPDAHLSSPPVPLGSNRGNIGNIAPKSTA
ncbi:zinc finger protein 34-like isoform X8 [Diprion similis]|uniref:zinc finger protein 34-like isoform X8 n=1 Tax=Diprion similis TaxID=362088 RepID=UPI001EF8E2D6|nr:zinc finger protein 34-like isoform X8 [Diprion similis]